jgi:glycosyltransferase involved in cell wall biosynthesis
MYDVAVLRTNSASHDIRVAKETCSQAKAGLKVLIIAWDRETGTGFDEYRNGVTIKRLRLKAPIGTPSLVLYFPIFWAWASIQILISKPLAIHACDFDTMPIGLFVKIVKRKTKLVYDCFEYYQGMVSAFLTFPFFNMISILDRVFMEIADFIIIPCEERRKFYPAAKNILVLPNAPKMMTVNVGKRNGKFTLFYGGMLELDRGLFPLIKTVNQFDDIQLVIAGTGTLANDVKKLSERVKNITYMGMLPYDGLLHAMANADVAFAFYESTNPNNLTSASNKVFEAMMLGIPVITNEECASSRIILKHECGLVVPYGDISALSVAISLLKNNVQFRKKLGENGRIAFSKWYAWDIVEPDFIRSYLHLIKTHQQGT